MIRFIFSVIGLLFIYCGIGSVTGTETETHTGTVSGSIINEDSTEAELIPVYFHFLSGDSATIFETQTDRWGRFFIDSLPVGDYMVEGVSLPMAAVKPIRIIEGDTVSVKAQLSLTGVVIGKVCIPFLERIIKVSARIPEINRMLRLDSTGYFELSALPPYENYTLEFQSLNIPDASPFSVIELDVPSGDTVNVGNIALFTGSARMHAPRVNGDSLAAFAEVVVSSSDILPIKKAAEVRDSEFYATIPDIPEGMDRIFSVAVYDSTRQILFSGADTVDIVVDSIAEVTITLSAFSGDNIAE